MGKGIKKATGIANKNPLWKSLGISTDDEQGAYNDQAELQGLLRSKDPNVDPIAGMNTATKYVQDNALTKGVFGEGGLQSQLGDEGRDLAGNGFQLQQRDREAYGQASGDISRLFGQQEQDASQALARRGLGSSSSGAAGAAFSGLAGNKNEMLAQAQTSIAQKRMADTQNRLVQNRNLQASLASQGNAMAGDQFGRQVQGRSNRIGELQGLEASKSGVMEAQKAAIKPGLFSTIGQGLQAGVGNLATQAPGMAATGGASAASGGGAGGGLFGQSGGGQAGTALGNPGQASTGRSNKNYGNYA